MSLRIGNIALYMGPKGLGGPDELRQAIVSFINGAQKRLDIAVQELDDWEIAKAIISAKQRKVRVRLVLESDYLRSSRTAEFSVFSNVRSQTASRRQWKIKRHGPSAEAVDLNISLAQPDLRLPPGYLKKVNSTSLVS